MNHDQSFIGKDEFPLFHQVQIQKAWCLLVLDW